MRTFTTSVFLLFAALGSVQAQHSVAREWNERQLAAIRKDFGRPTVQARNLFHVSVAMYDAWAAYDDEAEPFLLGKTVGNYTCPFNGVPPPADLQDAREEAISYAAYRVMFQRYQYAPPANVAAILDSLEAQMEHLGYDPSFTSTDYSTGSPAALGNYIGQHIIGFGLNDGANEPSYANQYYTVANAPMIVKVPGNPNLLDPNRWQQVSLDVFIDQNGNPIGINTPNFLTPEWGNVVPFSLSDSDLSVFERDGDEYRVFLDPGEPPYLDSGNADEYKWGFELVSIWSSHLDPTDGVMWDVSPAGIGNIQDYPTTLAEYHDFYDLTGGGDNSPGHTINPKTGLPYETQMVPRGDYARVLAEFWADGPNSETPPGHWFTIMNYVTDQPDFQRRFRGQGPVLDPLEYDVKAYFALGGAMHDAAVTCWGIKGWYDYVRPVSAIRYMADKGQSSDPLLPHYHPHGLRLQPGFIELVEPGDPLAGDNNENLFKIKIKSWNGPDFITNPTNDVAGVGWTLADYWWPFQRPTFVTPPFAGYISGHSTYSRTAAELLTALTNDPYFPGGMGVFPAPQNQFLVFEDGPSVDVTLQWATYRDASDQCSLSRIWGGIHPPCDDIPGRHIGMVLGPKALGHAENYFYNDADGDGFFSYQECDDANAAIYPGAAEICDGLDNDCNGNTDDGLTFSTYYLDADQDGYGDAAESLSSCQAIAPTGYASTSDDCDDAVPNINPGAAEICDGLDNDCTGQADDGLTFTTYYLDDDGDGYGDAASSISSCQAAAPTGYAASPDDCDDDEAAINPAATEVCNSIDDDCNGTADDGLPTITIFLDEDGDGYGTDASADETCETSPPVNYVLTGGDCDDTNAEVSPDGVEIEDGLDNDCNGLIDDVNATGEVAQLPHRISPNPTSGQLVIEYAFMGKMTVEVFRMEGSLAQKAVLDFGGSQANLSLESLPQGVYLLVFTDGQGRRHFVERVVKI